jgi:hypothetical protein
MRAALATLAQGTSFGTTANVWNFYAEGWVSENHEMKRPVVGVIGNTYLAEGRFASQRVGERSLRAVADVVGALPMMFAGSPEITDIDTLLQVVDGVLLTGARANVHRAAS